MWAAGAKLNALAMQTFKIKTYRDGMKAEKPHFYILSKGNNAGKPLENPCPNCFLVTTPCENSKEQIFWLAYGLWQGKCFHEYLSGSVITFIRIKHVKNLLETSLRKAQSREDKFTKSIAMLKGFEENTKILKLQLDLMERVKRAVVWEVLRE